MTEWAAVEAALDGVLQRRWYTNHGSKAVELEAQAAARFGARHAVVATNPTIGLVMLAEALGLTGEVLLPAFASRRCAQSLRWAGLRPVFCDVDPATGRTTADTAAPQMTGQTSAILVTGGADAASLAALAAGRGLILYGETEAAPHGPAMHVLSCCGDEAGVACLAMHDDALAARLRNIRSSYGAGPPVPVRRTANGRVSEIQAALALLALDDKPALKTYRAALPGRDVFAASPGAALLLPPGRDLVVPEGARLFALDERADCPIAASMRLLLLPPHPTPRLLAALSRLR